MARKATRKKTSTRKTTTKAKRTTAKKAATKKRATAKKKTATKRKATAKKASTKRTTKKATTKKAAAKPAPIKKERRATKPRNTSTLSYTQSEFLENLRGFCGLQKKTEAKEMWNDISLFIQDSLKKGYRVPLVGLGKMYVRKSKARMGRNPATGETIHIPARKRVRFTVAKALKDTVL